MFHLYGLYRDRVIRALLDLLPVGDHAKTQHTHTQTHGFLASVFLLDLCSNTHDALLRSFLTVTSQYFQPQPQPQGTPIDVDPG